MFSSTIYNALALGAIILPNLTGASVIMSEFQAIVGFPTACTAAYDTPVTACKASDFQNGNACSSACVAGLTALQTAIDAACQGSKANPDSLIGLFFTEKGVESLCPNVASSSSSTTEASSTASSTLTTSTSSATSTTTSTSTSSISATSSSSVVAKTSSTAVASTTTSTSSTSSVAAETISSAVTSSSSSSTATSTVSSDTKTSSSSVTTTSVSRNTKGFTTTVFNDGAASTITSKSQQTDSSNPDSFGGGGSPFEVGANGNSATSLNGTNLLVVTATALAAVLVAMGML